MRFTGISDEAGPTLDEQVRAHQALGWSFLELRKCDGQEVALLPEDRCRQLADQLAEAGMSVAGIGSPIANGARRISDPFERSIEELQSALRNAAILGTNRIRVMSYGNDGLAEAEWRAEAVRQLRELGDRAEDAGATLLVENCSGWAAGSPERYAAFFAETDHPAIRAVFDTGNPASHHDGAARVLEWFEAARPHLAHVHIKDHTGRAAGIEPRHLWPGEGVCQVREIMAALDSSGYGGFFSIEPHLGIHPDCATRWETYVEYGRRLMALAGTVSTPTN